MSSYSFGADPIACHAYNKSRTQLALSPNNNEVHIYEYRGGRWEKVYSLTEHTQRVTGIDWAPESNRIVTCGADRNAYVWTYEAGKWKPELVILRINRAATCCRWSPKEDKFAVGSGARLVAVCYFEPEHNWWVSKHIKKPLRSTVTSIDWHPNNILIACGSTDFKARVFSAYVKDVEKKPEATSWGKKMTFGNCMAEYSNGGVVRGGWVHDVSFSGSGEKLAWVGHDSSISVVVAGKEPSTLKTQLLPFTTCTWVTENSIVVAGHDCCPMLFTHDDHGHVTFMHKLDAGKHKEGGGTISAMKRFQSLDKRGHSDDKGTTVDTVHQNTITQLSILEGTKDRVTKFITTGVDGQLCTWDFRSLESSIAGLRIL